VSVIRERRTDDVPAGVVASGERRVDDGDPRRVAAVGGADACPSAIRIPKTWKYSFVMDCGGTLKRSAGWDGPPGGALHLAGPVVAGQRHASRERCVSHAVHLEFADTLPGLIVE
jgi:hypothetical protein